MYDVKDRPPAPLTPLARSVRASTRRATPVSLFELASAKWLRGERLELVQLAAELGVARATVFRWAGTRELLYGEVISAAYARHFEHIVRTTSGKGIEKLARVSRRNLTALTKAGPLRQFVALDPEFAIRVLTSNSSPVQARSMALEVGFLRQIIDEERIKPVLDLETLAFIIIRIGESFLYTDAISGRRPEIDKAVAAIGILVSAARPPRGLKSTTAAAKKSAKRQR